jgi:hypothetical protein
MIINLLKLKSINRYMFNVRIVLQRIFFKLMENTEKIQL